MARKSTSPADAAAKATECCAKCERDIAALRKEVAALKAELAKGSAGGADPRVDKIIEAIKLFGTAQRQKLEKAGL
jgi:hypothetical protein